MDFKKNKQGKNIRTITTLLFARCVGYSAVCHQIYMKQQQDLQFLHFNLESSEETKQTHKREMHETR